MKKTIVVSHNNPFFRISTSPCVV